MVALTFSMLERLAIIVSIAFVATRLPLFKQLINQQAINGRQRVIFTILFGLFGIIGTYTALTVDTNALTYSRYTLTLQHDQALANSRVIGVVLAGLLGGLGPGLGAGLIAGVHRYFLGGFTAFACGFSAIVAGLLAGLVHRRLKRHHPLSIKSALITGAAAETVQMSIILLLARPFDQALDLVVQIGIPMIVANGLGSALFVVIIRNVRSEEEKSGALQAQKALRLADLTIRHLREGLNETTGKKTCEILLKETHASAVALTNQTHIIAHVGLADDHHRAQDPIQTAATKDVIQTGQLMIVSKQDIQCDKPDCPLGAAVIAPLNIRETTVGTLKFYYRSNRQINTVAIELVKGLSVLLGQQLEIAESEKYIKLARESEIKALQAQISPHFLFNALNTIVSLVRTDPDKARRLLISLSRYIRQNVTTTHREQESLREELNHVKAYLEIEEARFADQFTVYYHVDEAALNTTVPPLTLQPLVENAIKHGLKPLPDHGMLTIVISHEQTWVKIAIVDNGVGMDATLKSQLLRAPADSKNSTGIGLYNVNRRLVMTYGEKSRLHIDSHTGEGTTFYFYIPAGGSIQ
ncbi:sensor histidine kinase [Tuberibacillus sp. Marseille-P3662]|uniref:sensor histidine kinase n=1 Tax=Tuberibacillus sp. Marseille-P3662 TaxID=1965358 RepID=UPI000A1CF002|nr:sensor histidine kinase [Tuberibacillus sp. Marseille-P3662]